MDENKNMSENKKTPPHRLCPSQGGRQSLVAGQANISQMNMVSIEQYAHWAKCQLNKCANAISQLNNVSIEHNLPLFDNMGPNEFTPPDEQYNIECRIMIRTTMDPSRNWSKPQLIQATIDPNHNESKGSMSIDKKLTEQAEIEQNQLSKKSTEQKSSEYLVIP